MLQIKIDTKKLVAALAKCGVESVSVLRKEMGEQMAAVQEKAKQEHRFTARGGFLERSVTPFVSASGLLGRVYLSESIAPYGAYVHNGTGVYGPRHSPIVPKTAQLLRWKGLDGKWHSAKSVRGMKPDKFLYHAFDGAKKAIRDGMLRAYKTVLRNGGLA